MSKKNLESIKYKKAPLALLNKLNGLTDNILFSKDETGKKLICQRYDASRTICFFFEAPLETFDFKGDEIAFYQFSDFFQFIENFNTPTISQNGGRELVLSKGNSRITYLTTEPETLPKGPKSPNLKDIDASFELSSENLKEIREAIGLLNAEKIEITCKGKHINFRIYNSGHENSFETDFEATKFGENFSFKVLSNFFIHLPDKKFKIDLKKEGIIRALLMDPLEEKLPDGQIEKIKMKLELITAEIEDD